MCDYINLRGHCQVPLYSGAIHFQDSSDCGQQTALPHGADRTAFVVAGILQPVRETAFRASSPTSHMARDCWELATCGVAVAHNQTAPTDQ